MKLPKAVAPGDVVTITRIDRLARSTFDLFAIVKQIVNANEQFRSRAEPWADTVTRAGRLMIAVLGGSRTLSATSSAPARRKAGAGRRRAGSTGPTAEAYCSNKNKHGGGGPRGQCSRELAKSYNVGRATISRLGWMPAWPGCTGPGLHRHPHKLDCVHKMPTLRMFEWDEAKRLKNRTRRGLDFADASLVFDGRPIITAPSFRNNEDRFVSTAEINGHLYSVVWMWRGQNQRIISFRRAGNAEERAYREAHG